MKILLLGEFSGVHKYLTQGLRELGHEVLFISFGDGFKKIEGDINFFYSDNKITKQFQKINIFSQLLQICKDFEVVQILSPFIIMSHLKPLEYLFNYIKKHNNKVSLYLCATDPIYWHIGTRLLNYSPVKDNIIIDYKNKIPKVYNNNFYEFYIELAKKMDFLIPSMYEYALGYKELNFNLTEPIPLPINVSTQEYNFPNVDKLQILHGILREGFKGTKYIQDAINKLNQKYNNFDYTEIGFLPLNEYLDIIKRTNIIIDQTSSYSYGMNAIISLAQGKIVLSGSEKVAMDFLGIENSPIINITPDSMNIFEQIEILLNKNFEELQNLSLKSLEYVKKYHDHKIIAQKFIEIWKR